jgi:SAM-dependent methyltransferase
MKHRDKWAPSKFVYRRGKLIASRDQNEVGIGSRLIADLIAICYDAHIKEYARGKLIDLGRGKVPLYAAYKDRVTDNVCVDWENTSHDNLYLDFECDLTTDLPFKDREFDTIILSDVLEHIPQPERLWKEMSRILSNNGRILMNVPFYYWLHEEPNDYYRYTEFALRRFVESSGLKVTLLKPIGGAPEILADILAKNFLRYPKLGRPLAILVQQFAFAFIKTKFGKKVSEVTSAKFPLGYFLIAEKPDPLCWLS